MGQRILRIAAPVSIVKREDGRKALSKSLDLCFLNRGLPQGTPISHFITKVMMIPFDHVVSNTLRNFEKMRFVYTRYADDLLISCKHDFDPGAMNPGHSGYTAVGTATVSGIPAGAIVTKVVVKAPMIRITGGPIECL